MSPFCLSRFRRASLSLRCAASAAFTPAAEAAMGRTIHNSAANQDRFHRIFIVVILFVSLVYHRGTETQRHRDSAHNNTHQCALSLWLCASVVNQRLQLT